MVRLFNQAHALNHICEPETGLCMENLRPTMLRLVLRLRYVLLIAAVGAMVSSLGVFWIGALRLIEALRGIIDKDPKLAVASILGATDSFLFGIVLLVFASGITFGFVFELTSEERGLLPKWMRIDGITDLKHRLIQIIVLYLIVDFATDWVDGSTAKDGTFLLKPMAILLITIAARVLASEHHESKPHSDRS